MRHSTIAKRAAELRQAVEAIDPNEQLLIAIRTDDARGDIGDATRELRALRNAISAIFAQHTVDHDIYGGPPSKMRRGVA